MGNSACNAVGLLVRDCLRLSVWCRVQRSFCCYSSHSLIHKS